MQRDMTWTNAPSDLLAEDNSVSAAIGRYHDAFTETLESNFHLKGVGHCRRAMTSNSTRNTSAPTGKYGLM